MRQQITVERPAALHEVPGVYRDYECGDKADLGSENIAHEKIKEQRAENARDQQREPERDDAQAEKPDERCDHI